MTAFTVHLSLIQRDLSTRKESKSTTHNRLSEPDTVSDLYRIDHIHLIEG